MVARPAGEGPPLTGPEPDRFRVGRPQSNFTREAYLKAVSRIREYISNGDVYQVNLTQRFSFPLSGEPYHLLRRLFHLNPAPFYAYLNCDEFPGALHLHGALSATGGTIISRPGPSRAPGPGGPPPQRTRSCARNWPAPRTTPSSP